jgi:hypothetical protein
MKVLAQELTYDRRRAIHREAPMTTLPTGMAAPDGLAELVNTLIDSTH